MPYDDSEIGLADSWQDVVDLEPITYYPRIQDGLFSPTNGARVENCKREEVTKGTTGTSPMLPTYDTVWHVWQTQLANAGLSNDPKIRDRFVDDNGIGYTVQKVQILAQRTRFALYVTEEIPTVGSNTKVG